MKSWGERGHRARPVPPAARDRDRSQRQRLCRRSLEPAHPGVRCRRTIPADVHHRRAAAARHAAGQRQHADRRGDSPTRSARPTPSASRPAPNQVMFVGESTFPGRLVQGVARGQGARRHRPVGPSAQTVLRRAPARVPVRTRGVCGRDVELAGAEVDPAVSAEAGVGCRATSAARARRRRSGCCCAFSSKKMRR